MTSSPAPPNKEETIIDIAGGKPRKLRIVVLASGRGTDFQALIDAQGSTMLAEIVALITDNPHAQAIERAKAAHIPYYVIDFSSFSDRLEYDRTVKKKIDELHVDLVVLAGYMKLIKDEGWLSDYKGRMINIHPSLLPAFPGAHAQRDAYEYGVKISGYTIHFVDASLDGGIIIWQEAVDISHCHSATEVAMEILKREHIGLPKVVDMFARGRFVIEGRRARYETF